MNHDDHDDLWDLLGKAKTPQVSPFFSRNVLRAIREEQPAARPGLISWLRARWRVAVIGGGTLAVLAAVTIDRFERPDAVSLLASKVSASPDYQVISHLDELLDSEENSVWLEASAY
jgi:hypothetical protein